MNKLFLILAAGLLMGCGSEYVDIVQRGEDGIGCTIDGTFIRCDDGTSFDLTVLEGEDGLAGLDGSDGLDGQDGTNGTDGQDGANGQDGADGTNGQDGTDGQNGTDGQDGDDGEDAVVLHNSFLSGGNGNCAPIFPGLWGQYLDGGYVMDVYTNDTCNDYTGAEVCDNVAMSFGAGDNPPVGWEHPGGASVCWHGNLMISGQKLSGKIKVFILEFNL